MSSSTTRRAGPRARRSSAKTCSSPCTRSLPARRGTSRPPAAPTTTCSTMSACVSTRARPAASGSPTPSSRWRRGSAPRASSRRRPTAPARAATTASPAPPPSAELGSPLRVGAALAQELLEVARECVARGELLGVELLFGLLLLLVRGLEPLDEGLDVRVGLHGRVHLALVVAGGLLERRGVDGDADERLELAHERERGLRVG